MKRSGPMKRRSTSNSRHWEDLEFRASYLAEHPWCELSPMLVGIIPGLMKREAATDPHHLIGGAGRRVDIRSNLLAVCRPVHLWAHANLKDSRVLGIWWKVRQGEFRADEFKRVSGKFLAGWLIGNVPREPLLIPLWEELVTQSKERL